VLCAAPASGQPRLSASATPAWITTLTLLIKVSVMVTDYRGHHRTLFFSAWYYLHVHHVCGIGIIWNNSLVEGRRALTDLWTRLLLLLLGSELSNWL